MKKGIKNENIRKDFKKLVIQQFKNYCFLYMVLLKRKNKEIIPIVFEAWQHGPVIKGLLKL
ncbi:hypothetical protein [Spiroplasma citri]|uniref:hypothetical protein n=1 Tax=Spiroplasma citri TaxID=2133 RepID=UPI00247A4D64|nr:hypothetical protein [Spiroplasma citri]